MDKLLLGVSAEHIYKGKRSSEKGKDGTGSHTMPNGIRYATGRTASLDLVGLLLFQDALRPAPG